MSGSVLRRLAALAALGLVLVLAACGGSDEESDGGSPAPAARVAASVTDKLFAGSATET